MSTTVNLPNPAAICSGSLEDQKAEAGGIPVFWLCLLSAIVVLKASWNRGWECVLKDPMNHVSCIPNRFKVMFHLEATYLLYLSGSSETLPGSTWFGDELAAVTFSSEAHVAPNSDKNFTFNEFLAAWWYLSLTLATAEKMDPKDQSSGKKPTGDSGSFMDHVLWNLCIMGAVNMEE